MSTIRQPSQLRSIETKNKIILAGYNLFAKNGYYKTNTMQIAKEAGVSTGIVYGYFGNKKDILIEVIKEYINKTYNPVFCLLEEINKKQNLQDLVVQILDIAEKLHKENFEMHKELSSISQNDSEINKTFMGLEDTVTKKFSEKLKELGYKNIDNENIHLSMNLIQSYVHEAVFDNHDYIDYEKLKNKVVKLICALFE